LFCKEPLEHPGPSAAVLALWKAGTCNTDTPAVKAALTPTNIKNASLNKQAVQAAKTIVPEDSTVLGTSWQADVLNGVATFLEARVKAELLASLIDHLQAELCTNKKSPDFAKYLLSTCALIGSSDPYTTPTAWSALKAAIESDLRALPQNVVSLGLGIKGDDGEPLVAFGQIAERLVRGDNPLSVLVGLQNRYSGINSNTLCDQFPFACSLRLFGEAVEVFAPQPPLDQPRGAPALSSYFQIAARLLYDANDELVNPDDPNSGSTKTLTPADLLTPSQLTVLYPKLVTFSSSLSSMTVVANDASANSGTSASEKLQTFNNYARNVAGVINFDLVGAIAPISPAHAKAVTGDDLRTALQHLELAYEHARAGEYVQSFAELNAALLAADVLKELPAWYTRYGGFLAEVASAKSADDAQKAFEAAAEPVGAWRQKRGKHHSALTINGYVGVQGGGEWLSGHDVASSRAWQGGLFAPIGFEASKGFCKDSSIGVLLSVIDLGALVDFRDGTNANPNVGFRQVFSPGLYALYGLPIGPITAGGGVSLAPELRSVNLNGGTLTQDVNAIRLSVFFAVDVTIFGL
jgi:hypothetical protein